MKISEFEQMDPIGPPEAFVVGGFEFNDPFEARDEYGGGFVTERLAEDRELPDSHLAIPIENADAALAFATNGRTAVVYHGDEPEDVPEIVGESTHGLYESQEDYEWLVDEWMERQEQ